MVSAITVANTILTRAQKDNMNITPMKLQKLTYILYKEYLKRTGRPLFPERFEVWKYGPVLRNINEAFKEYGTNVIRSLCKDRNGYIYIVNEKTSPIFTEVLDSVWRKYKMYNGIKLSEMTHKKDTAWYKAAKNNRDLLSDDDILAEESFV